MTRPELIEVLSFVPGFTSDMLSGLPSERLVELYSDYFEGQDMNERFQQLLKQSTNPPWDGEQGPMNEFNLERFAELIVRECVAICQDIDGEDSSDGRCARQDCSVEIREHFGVEE